ncbi:hypothetical protein B0H12DRAFT_1116787 [Mycena haematopus]|nr:hypothetical protein B0H12DRAFT_1116787 [Mycena haematopus]
MSSFATLGLASPGSVNTTRKSVIHFTIWDVKTVSFSGKDLRMRTSQWSTLIKSLRALWPNSMSTRLRIVRIMVRGELRSISPRIP